jgi:hypothetical protein
MFFGGDTVEHVVLVARVHGRQHAAEVVLVHQAEVQQGCRLDLHPGTCSVRVRPKWRDSLQRSGAAEGVERGRAWSKVLAIVCTSLNACAAVKKLVAHAACSISTRASAAAAASRALNSSSCASGMDLVLRCVSMVSIV